MLAKVGELRVTSPSASRVSPAEAVPALALALAGPRPLTCGNTALCFRSAAQAAANPTGPVSAASLSRAAPQPQHRCVSLSLFAALQAGADFLFGPCLRLSPASQVVLVAKNPPARAGDLRDLGSIPGGEHGNPLRDSCLETEEPGGLQSMGSQRVLSVDASLKCCCFWRSRRDSRGRQNAGLPWCGMLLAGSSHHEHGGCSPAPLTPPPGGH